MPMNARKKGMPMTTIAHHSLLGSLVLGVLGVLIVTLLTHVARDVARGHARLAKALLVEPGA